MVGYIVIVGDTISRIISGMCESLTIPAYLAVCQVLCSSQNGVLLTYSLMCHCTNVSLPCLMLVAIYNTPPPAILVNSPFIKTLCILLVMLPVSSLRNIVSLEKVTAFECRGIPL